MRISTKRSDLPEGKYLGSRARYLGLIVPILFLLINFQTAWSQQLSVTANVTSAISCVGYSNGEAMAIADQGTAPYSFEWTGGQTGDAATGFIAGTYYVTVTDATSATATSSVTFYDPAALSLALTPSNYNGYGVSQFGLSDGDISSTVLGGTGAY